jgi:hypothetical protein
MFKAYVVLAILTAGANVFAAISDFTRPEWLRANMTKVRVPDSWVTTLGILKAAGALALLVGIGIPFIGTAAAAGLTLFFVGAIITHLRAHDRSFGVAILFLLLAVSTLVLGLYAGTPRGLGPRL